MSDQNRRIDFRLNLKVPLLSSLRIVGINNKSVETNAANVAIADISTGGIRIHTDLDLPPRDNLLLEFRFRLFGKEIRLLGTIIRMKKLNAKITEYGIRFSMNEQESSALRGHLQLLEVRLRRSPEISSCSFCTMEDLKSFYTDA